MARGPASSLFHLCTPKRITLSNFKALIFNHSYTSSPSQFHSSPNHFHPISTHLLNPRFLPSFSQSLNLSSVSTLPMRPFSAAGDEGGAAAEHDRELDVGTGESVDFDHGNEVSDHVRALPNSSNDNDEFEKKSGEFMHVASRDPVELYNELKSVGKRVWLNRSEMEVWAAVFHYFIKSDWASNQALTIYIYLYSFNSSADSFLSFFRKHCPEDVFKYLLSLGPCDDAVRFLFPIFVEFCLENFPLEIKMFRSLVESAVLIEPHTSFSFQKAMKRKIIYHCGPTNSGKTYNALQRFMEAERGIYCGPHRLLAMEVFDKAKVKGVYCSLYTRQEKKRVGPNHAACTVEMVSTSDFYDVAIIDEIQMLADPYRGFSWTNVLLDLQADEVHLCGDPRVLDIVRKVCQGKGDELHEQQYERFKPLVVEAKTLLGNLQNIRSGDCVVSFSMREIFEVKLAIERETNNRCCVIHGDLPLEIRTQQANLFNDQSNEYDVLVASDVVGMGLDLNIRRVVFNSVTKYNWDKEVRVPASQVKQIAGRAGSRGCLYPDGLATTLHLDDLDYLIECLKQPFDRVTWVWPPM